MYASTMVGTLTHARTGAKVLYRYRPLGLPFPQDHVPLLSTLFYPRHSGFWPRVNENHTTVHLKSGAKPPQMAMTPPCCHGGGRPDSLFTLVMGTQ